MCYVLVSGLFGSVCVVMCSVCGFGDVMNFGVLVCSVVYGWLCVLMLLSMKNGSCVKNVWCWFGMKCWILCWLVVFVVFVMFVCCCMVSLFV